MITENKLKHMLGVARKCYSVAKEKGYSEDTAREYWLMGLLHDIGYEFIDSNENPDSHPQIAYDFLDNQLQFNLMSLYNDLLAIKFHGDSSVGEGAVGLFNLNIYDRIQILNYADMTTDTEGKETTIKERLEDIKERYGKDSDVYKKAVALVKKQNLSEMLGTETQK